MTEPTRDDRAGATGVSSRKAHAKVNLTLAVTGRRPDGYHELASIFLRLDLADDLEVVIGTPAPGPDTLVVEGDPGCPIEGNLVLRAAALLRLEAGRQLPRLAFRLHKRIAMGAGLAGGSSDAAAALDLAANAWHLPDDAAHDELAIKLGADVPFFGAHVPVALVRGVGESVEGLPPLVGGAGVLLVTPESPVPTPAVFAEYDRSLPSASGARSVTEDLAARLRTGLSGADLGRMAADLRDANDLWPAAARVAPRLAGLRATLEVHLGQPVLLTGSGSTLVTLYPSLDAAESARVNLAASAPSALAGCRVVATQPA